MIPLAALVVLLVGLGSVLAIAEASISRMSRAKALALKEEGHRTAALLERIVSAPGAHLGTVRLAAACAQNGALLLVAVIVSRSFEPRALAIPAVVFTLGYFVLVEAMARTLGVRRGTSAALALAPLVWGLHSTLGHVSRALVKLANVLLLGKGLPQGPFGPEEETRAHDTTDHEHDAREEHEEELIHSVFEFGDTVVREVMIPRPDLVAIDVNEPLHAAEELILEHGYSRIPVYRDDIDQIEGILYAKDVLKVRHQGQHDTPLSKICRPPRFVPSSKHVADLLRDMQREKFHMAIVTDEYGSLAGVVTLEDLIEELVGEIADEYDADEPKIEEIANATYRVSGRLAISELNELLDVDLPHEEWDTVGGLMLGLLDAIPKAGQEVHCKSLCFRAEKVKNLAVETVMITQPGLEGSELQRNASASGGRS